MKVHVAYLKITADNKMMNISQTSEHMIIYDISSLWKYFFKYEKKMQVDIYNKIFLFKFSKVILNMKFCLLKMYEIFIRHTCIYNVLL